MANFDAEYDVVVVGCGAAGKSAAYTVASESDLSVCILEKMPDMMCGTSIFAEGMAAFESSEQKAREVPPEMGSHYPTCSEGFKSYETYTHERINRDVARSFVYNSGETIDILKSIGATFDDVGIYCYDQPIELNTFHYINGMCLREQQLLDTACRNSGVDFFYSTRAGKILKEGNKVVGIEATDSDGNQMAIKTSAVILATGGYGNNPDKLDEYSWIPNLSKKVYTFLPCQNTGDGIDMALDAGGALGTIGAVGMICCADGSTCDTNLTAAGAQPFLWVDSTAKRFVHEDISLVFTDHSTELAKTPEGKAYTIFDSDQLEHLKAYGSEIGLGAFIPYQKPLEKFDMELEANDGTAVCKSGTIDGIAEHFGLDAETLKETVEEYNKLCENRCDTQFYKNGKYMRPIKKAPFYCVCMRPSVLASCGAISVNGDMQVCDESYKPVEGLYATGWDAAGLMGDSYNINCPGTGHGFALTSGRIAARHAIGTIKG